MKTILITTAFIIGNLASVTTLQAFTVEHNQGVPVEKNFVVGPAKIEKTVEAGDSEIVTIVVDNKTGQTQDLSIHFEDFTSGEGDQVVKLLGNNAASNGLKKFLSVEKTEFTLLHGDRAIIPVTISLPVGERGGKFGSVVVSATFKSNGILVPGNASTGAVVVGNVATLLFVTIPGSEMFDAAFVSVKTKNDQKVFFQDTVPLRFAFQNSGNVSVNPYGFLVVKNIFGTEVSRTSIDPWFVLPQSIRTRDVQVGITHGFGYYKAIAQVNRGYEDIVDQKEISFFLIPPFVVVLSGLVLGALLFTGIRKFIKRRQ